MHRYSQSTGRWVRNGQLVGIGYAGFDDGDGVPEPGEGKNDPSKQAVRSIGPLPQGRYKIGFPYKHPTAGALTMRLTPLPGTDTFGRSGFLIHGDSRTRPGTASQGCVVLGYAERSAIAAAVMSGDDVLEVIP